MNKYIIQCLPNYKNKNKKLNSVRGERPGRHLSRAQIKYKSGPELMEEGSQAKNELGRGELGVSLLTSFISISFIHSTSLCPSATTLVQPTTVSSPVLQKLSVHSPNFKLPQNVHLATWH